MGQKRRDPDKSGEAAAALAFDMARLTLELMGDPPSGWVVVADERGNPVVVVCKPEKPQCE